MFKQVMSVFEGSTKDPQVANISVTVRPNMPGVKSARKEKDIPSHSTRLKSLWSTTDNAQFKEIDPQTLEPIGLASQKSLHPQLKGPMSCAHAQSDPETGDVFNYNMTLGPEAVYRVFKTSAKTGQTEILATITGNGVKSAYLHSFFKTEDFLILCIWNSRYESMGLKILLEQNLLDAIAPFDPSQPARWFVVDRKYGRGLVAEFESPAFFCFHTVNAWQEVDSEGNLNIICNCVEYESLDILHALYYKNMTSTGKDAVNFNNEKGLTSLPRLARYRLSNIGTNTLRKRGTNVPQADLVFHMEKRQVGELPTINPLFEMKENRYIYSIVNRGYSTFFDGISKGDTMTKNFIFWENEEGHTPGEAIFVPNPEGVEEDDGILLSVVLDGFKGTSYLLCLDAKTMKEVGRATCEWAVGLGFHGAHVQL
jgi:torulene dioxygenase